MDASWPPIWPKMAKDLRIFDPKGDVLLILERCPGKDIVEYVDEESVLEWGGDAPPAESDETASAEPPPDWQESEPSPEESQVEESVLYDLDTVVPEAQAELEKCSTKPGGSPGSVSATSSNIEKIQMRVSSKHLILASATFCRYLGSEEFYEGQTLLAEGNVVVPLGDDEDLDAMVILLHIIHGQTRKVPRQVNLKMLSKIAFIVNHRQMHEAVELFSDTWIANLKHNPLPSSYTTEVLSWLFIFWVFQKEDDFRNMSQILERESDHTLDIDHFVPASIIRNIQEKRLHSIESMIQVIEDLITKYSVSEIFCHNSNPFACDAILLGSLLKGSTVVGILPRPINPYPGITFKALAEQIRGIKVLDNCRHAGQRGGFYSSGNGHGIKESIEASILSIEDSMCGLELRSFLPKRTKRGMANRVA